MLFANNSNKSRKHKNSVKDILKVPKISLEKVRVKYNGLSIKESIPRITVRMILKKKNMFQQKCRQKDRRQKIPTIYPRMWTENLMKKAAEFVIYGFCQQNFVGKSH